MAKYEVLHGLNWVSPRGNQRAEPGEVRDDLPEKSIDWLLRDGLIKNLEAGEE